jgi:hypothetical protein
MALDVGGAVVDGLSVGRIPVIRCAEQGVALVWVADSPFDEQPVEEQGLTVAYASGEESPLSLTLAPRVDPEPGRLTQSPSPRCAGVAFAAPRAGEAASTAPSGRRAPGPEADAQGVVDVAVGTVGAAVVAGVRGGWAQAAAEPASEATGTAKPRDSSPERPGENGEPKEPPSGPRSFGCPSCRQAMRLRAVVMPPATL